MDRLPNDLNFNVYAILNLTQIDLHNEALSDYIKADLPGIKGKDWSEIIDTNELQLSKMTFLEAHSDYFDIELDLIEQGELSRRQVGYTGMVEIPFSVPKGTVISKYDGLIITLPENF